MHQQLTVVIGGSEGVICHAPSGGKDDEVCNGHSRPRALTSKDCEDRGILESRDRTRRSDKGRG